jgi:hypothetical protein
MQSIEVLDGMVASEVVQINPYLGQPHRYGDPGARSQRRASVMPILDYAGLSAGTEISDPGRPDARRMTPR